MSPATPRRGVPSSRSHQPADVEQEVPLLRIHVVSARGLPRSFRAVGMPDPFVVVKLNGDKVGATKADRKTRRPEWNQNFLVRSDLLAETHSPADDDDEFDDDDNDDGKYECEYSRGRRDEHEHQHYPDAAVKESFDSDRRKDTQCAADLGADFGADLNDAGPDEFAADSGGDGVDSADEVGDDKSSANSQGNRTNVAPATRAAAVACGRCRACRKRGTEIVLEVWDQYIPDQELDRMGGMGGAGGGITGEGGRQRRRRKRSSVGKPNDLFDDRLFDASFASRCLQRGALKRVRGAVIGANRLIGVCHISCMQLRALGASAVPMDLALRDPRGAWWSLNKGTIRVGVSVEQLQAKIIGVDLARDARAGRVSLDADGGGAGGVTGGVAGAACEEFKGEEASPPVELSCKALWNGEDFSNPTRWEKGFCVTEANHQLWLDVRAPHDLSKSPPLSPVRRSPQRSPAALFADATDTISLAATLGLDDDSPAIAPAVVSKACPSVPLTAMMTPGVKDVPRTPGVLIAAEGDARATILGLLVGGEGGDDAESSPASVAAVATGLTAATGVTAAAGAAAAAMATAAAAAALAVATVASAGATAALATATRAAEAMPPSPGAAIAAAVARGARSSLSRLPDGGRLRRRNKDRTQRRHAVSASDWAGDQSCVLSVGRMIHLSTFDAQGLADILNSREASTERMAGTKEWHDKGFRVHWDSVRRRFIILNVSRKSFVLRGSCSSLAQELLGFGTGDYVSEPVAEALLDPQHPSDSPKRHLAVTAEHLPPPLLQPRWMRIVWGPPTMEIARGGELRVQVWAKQARGTLARATQRRLRRLSVGGTSTPPEEKSWLVGTALLDASEVCREATGKPIKYPLLSREALWKYERWKNASAAAATEASAAAASDSFSGPFPFIGSTRGSTKPAGARTPADAANESNGTLGQAWAAAATTAGQFLARQVRLYRRLKRRFAAAGLHNMTPIGAGGAYVYWELPQATRSSKQQHHEYFHHNYQRGYREGYQHGYEQGVEQHKRHSPITWRSGSVSAGFDSDVVRASSSVITATVNLQERGCNAALVLDGVGSAACDVGKTSAISGKAVDGCAGEERLAITGHTTVAGEREAMPVFGTRGSVVERVDGGNDDANIDGNGNNGGSVGHAYGDSYSKTAAEAEDGVTGHVWLSLKMRDPSMLLMRAVRQWHMARDEASVQQRRVAQLEARRLWMFMPGISLWRVLIQLAGISLLVSYCVTLTLRAYHSTSCRATFDCSEETDPKLASLREWQTLADNLLSVISFLDMLVQFRTAYVDSSSKIVIEPNKVALHYLRTWFIPDLWCSLPYGTMQPLLQPVLDEVEEVADSLSIASARHTATTALSESLSHGADSPLSLWVYKLSKRLHIGKINNIRGTRAFKYLDDSAMGVDLAVKQVVQIVRGRRQVLKWLGAPPKERGRIRKFFFRIGMTNKWTRIVLSYKLLGYAKVVGTLVRAMRVLAVAIQAVPRATRVLRLAAVFIRSYEGRRRSKDLHEASIVIQRRAVRHMALKVAERMQANVRRKYRTRASSESAITDIVASSSATTAGPTLSPSSGMPPFRGHDVGTGSRSAGRSRVTAKRRGKTRSRSRGMNEDSVAGGVGYDLSNSSGCDSGGGGKSRRKIPVLCPRRLGLLTPPGSRSSESDVDGRFDGDPRGGNSNRGNSGSGGGRRSLSRCASKAPTLMMDKRSPSLSASSDGWSECSWDEPRGSTLPLQYGKGDGDDVVAIPELPSFQLQGSGLDEGGNIDALRRRSVMAGRSTRRNPRWLRDRRRASSSPRMVGRNGGSDRGVALTLDSACRGQPGSKLEALFDRSGAADGGAGDVRGVRDLSDDSDDACGTRYDDWSRGRGRSGGWDLRGGGAR